MANNRSPAANSCEFVQTPPAFGEFARVRANPCGVHRELVNSSVRVTVKVTLTTLTLTLTETKLLANRLPVRGELRVNLPNCSANADGLHLKRVV